MLAAMFFWYGILVVHNICVDAWGIVLEPCLYFHFCQLIKKKFSIVISNTMDSVKNGTENK